MTCDPTQIWCQLDGIRELLDKMAHPNPFTVYVVPFLAVLVPILVAIYVSKYGRKTTLAAVDKQIRVAAEAENERWDRQLKDRADERDYQRKMDTARGRNARLAELLATLSSTSVVRDVPMTVDQMIEEMRRLTTAASLVDAEYGIKHNAAVGRWVRALPGELLDFRTRRIAEDSAEPQERSAWYTRSMMACQHLMHEDVESEAGVERFREILAWTPPAKDPQPPAPATEPEAP